MLITYHGHSEFYLEGADGFRLLTDPYDAHVGYPMGQYPADAVTVSHGHSDHNFTHKALGAPAIIDSAGVWRPAPDVTVTALPSCHDDAGGSKRGSNLIMKIEMDGLTLVHLGDQGCPLTPEQISQLQGTDLLLVPVGGYYTIDAAQALDVCLALRPKVIIPMHYKTSGANDGWPISDEKPFLRLLGSERITPMPLLRVTRGDLSQQPPLAVMEVRP